jgi:hypothetical protein
MIEPIDIKAIERECKVADEHMKEQAGCYARRAKSHNWNVVVNICDSYGIQDKVEECPHGILVDNRFIFSPSTSKWCNKGRYKWYRSKGFDSFLRRYVFPIEGIE